MIRSEYAANVSLIPTARTAWMNPAPVRAKPAHGRVSCMALLAITMIASGAACLVWCLL